MKRERWHSGHRNSSVHTERLGSRANFQHGGKHARGIIWDPMKNSLSVLPHQMELISPPFRLHPATPRTPSQSSAVLSHSHPASKWTSRNSGWRPSWPLSRVSSSFRPASAPSSPRHPVSEPAHSPPPPLGPRATAALCTVHTHHSMDRSPGRKDKSPPLPSAHCRPYPPCLLGLCFAQAAAPTNAHSRMFSLHSNPCTLTWRYTPKRLPPSLAVPGFRSCGQGAVNSTIKHGKLLGCSSDSSSHVSETQCPSLSRLRA